MTNLIRAELFKLRRNKTFWVLVGTITGFSSLLHLLIITDWWQVTGTDFDKAGLGELNGLTVLILPLIFNLIVSSFAGFFISTEFSQGNVIKNQIISGNKRYHIYFAKFIVFSFGSIIITILIPLVTGVIMLILFGHSDLFDTSNVMFIGRAFGLFTLQFLCFTALVLIISFVTEDSGKTILFTLLLSVMMFIIEKFVTTPFIKVIYENTFFYQFTEVFKTTLTSGEILKSILIGLIYLFVISLCGIFKFKRKEIK